MVPPGEGFAEGSRLRLALPSRGPPCFVGDTGDMEAAPSPPLPSPWIRPCGPTVVDLPSGLSGGRIWADGSPGRDFLRRPVGLPSVPIVSRLACPEPIRDP